ncbi:N(4)-(Beta-N-acetylglucosaminyl)-L-asparaginase-like isoform X2 [Xenia sp. Carnegie-2017]|uniref:N(4)-(Beta-N-acetylglucosaminyl)-L-asparaginase- like isoform X2 n=1 Tax=Xenia sp. Carnegie-2017 TaxID=2897299 RepID=UPI001F04CB4F|nr:N(4)-(Beta-N-acetylglucosaminyl)-L-asparaginase-like isoform X2 [Xenia sp. Carnegie-2017]
MTSRLCCSLIFFYCYYQVVQINTFSLPLVVNTWGPPFFDAPKKAWSVIQNGQSSLDAVEQGCSVCEIEQCDGTVGYGGSPDENGDTTLDAMIMDGETHDVGSVGCLKNIRSAISVARSVMEEIVGDDATQFAKQMGFKEQSLQTNKSLNIWKSWKKNNCQPNFWKNVQPDPKESCGPYKPIKRLKCDEGEEDDSIDNNNHDTIGMIVIDKFGRIAAGTTTNGLNHKISGRVGDSPIAGAGSYADKAIGGAAATGDGDVMMRFYQRNIFNKIMCYQAVQNMRNGMSPTKAAEDAIYRIAKYYPNFSGAIVTASIDGKFGAAAHKWTFFKYSVCSPNLNPNCQYFSVQPISNDTRNK